MCRSIQTRWAGQQNGHTEWYPHLPRERQCTYLGSGHSCYFLLTPRQPTSYVDPPHCLQTGQEALQVCGMMLVVTCCICLLVLLCLSIGPFSGKGTQGQGRGVCNLEGEDHVIVSWEREGVLVSLCHPHHKVRIREKGMWGSRCHESGEWGCVSVVVPLLCCCCVALPCPCPPHPCIVVLVRKGDLHHHGVHMSVLLSSLSVGWDRNRTKTKGRKKKMWGRHWEDILWVTDMVSRSGEGHPTCNGCGPNGPLWVMLLDHIPCSFALLKCLSARECQKRILVVRFQEESSYRPIFLVEGNGSVRLSEPEKSAAKGVEFLQLRLISVWDRDHGHLKLSQQENWVSWK